MQTETTLPSAVPERRGAWPAALPPWPVVLVLNALVAPFCLFGLHAGDTDTFYHLAAGRWMFEHGAVLDREAFSFTIPGRPWTNYYWAFEWLLFAAWRRLGLAGVLGVRAAFVLATANLFLYWVYRRTRGALPETLAFGSMVLVLYVRRSLNIRPHLFSYLALLVVLVLLDAFRGGRRWAAPALVAVCVLLANFHGVEYPIVLAAVLLHALDALRPHLRRPAGEILHDRAVVRWPILLVACTVAFLANPFGARVLGTPRIGANAEAMAQIVEMQGPSLESLGHLFPELDINSRAALNYGVLAGLLLLPGWIRRGRLLPAGFYVLGLALALDKGRFAVEFLLLAVPYVAEGVAEARRAMSLRSARIVRRLLLLGAVYVVVAAVVTVRTNVRGGNLEPMSTSFYPVGAVAYVQRYGLAGNLHCDPTIAGFVTWNLFPQVRVTMDMRTPEPFGPQEMWFSRVLGEAVSFERAASRAPVDMVLVTRSAPLATSLRQDARFAPIYADPWFILFAHERILSGRESLRLRTLPVMEMLEVGRIAPPPAEPPGLREEAQRLADVWPMNNLAQRALLWLLVSEGRLAEAHERASALEARFPRQGLYPFFDGLALRDMGRLDEAAAAFRRSIDATPDFVLPYATLGETLLALGRDRDALDLLERSVWNRWPTVSAAEYDALGRARLRAGRTGPAIEALERAEWLTSPDAPERPDVANDLAEAYLAAGEPRRALPLLEDALRRRPGFPPALANRARAKSALGATVPAAR